MELSVDDRDVVLLLGFCGSKGILGDFGECWYSVARVLWVVPR